ncbi:Cadmium, zinc and cobalt-transporting ATPase [bioreactor metagenome]|uniref:Cadmium, zinc and cobalt-transporting ATPase n=1 Tax=bioreactor metagenome TaxID=1076179 RepID=A0A645FS12_9ZZZZ
MKECGANPRDSEVRRVSSGGSAVYASYDGKYIGCCIISDSLKPDSVRAVRELKREGVSMTAMLTGDSKDEGERIGRLMEFDRVYSRLLPDQKVEKLEALISENENGSLIYVGDGINDAPVLARADVGMAMGALGSDAAIESADVVITDDNPLKVPLAVRLSKKTTSIVMQNIIFALSVKAVFIVLGAFGIAGMWSAVFADVGVTLIAVLNAARAARI